MPTTAKNLKAEVPIETHAKTSDNGTLTIPRALLKRVGVGAGQGIVLETSDDQIVVVPQPKKGVFAEFRRSGTPGIGPGKQAVLEWVRELRGE